MNDDSSDRGGHDGSGDRTGDSGDSAKPSPAAGPPTPLEKIEHASATARVPEPVGRGVFATGAIVLGGPTELAIDFVQSLVRPERISARVILPHAVAHRFAEALAEALAIYARNYGAEPREPARVATTGSPAPAADPSPAPTVVSDSSAGANLGGPADSKARNPAGGAPASGPSGRIADAYDRLKYPDELLGGAYANQVSITQSANEFCLDFVVQLFPRSVVTARIYLAASRVPDLLGSVRRSLRG